MSRVRWLEEFSKLAVKKLNAGTGDVAAKVGDGKETVIKVLKGDLIDIHRFGEAHFMKLFRWEDLRWECISQIICMKIC